MIMTKVKSYTKKVNGKTINVKSYSRKDPVLSAKEYLKTHKISAPFEDKSAELSVQFSINVPTTKDEDTPLTQKEINRRVAQTELFLTKNFGGKTSINAGGGYMLNGKVIQEPIIQVQSSMSKIKYQQLKVKLEKFIKDKQKEWSQHTIGYSFEDEFYLYPKKNAQDFMKKSEMDN